MKNLSRKCASFIVCLSFLCLGLVSVSAATGWKNTGWSNIDWAGKACNSETVVYDMPKYEYMSATAKIGDLSEKKEASNPSANLKVHAWKVGAYQSTCEYWGDAH